jgi:hypothetical protein
MSTSPPLVADPKPAWLRFWSRIRTSFPWLLGIAFGLRVFCIIVMHTYKFRTTDDNFSFGWEMGRIAASIASGHGFANPEFTRTRRRSCCSPSIACGRR